MPNNSVLKIVCVLGTRPEAIKLAPVIHALRQRPGSFQTLILTTAQHREMLDQILDCFSLAPDTDLDLMRPEQTLSDLTSRALSGLHEYLEKDRPDLVLGQGDTTTTMAAALASYYLRIPFAHVEAGLRTGDLYAPYPEEFNRRAVGLIAAYHFAPTPSAASNLEREGIKRDSIYVTGNTVIDSLFYTLQHSTPPAPPLPPGRPYVLMTCHRREIFGSAIREVFGAVRSLASAHPEISFWYPVHPNPNVNQPAAEILGGLPNVILSDPLGYVSFCHAMMGAWIILSDSGGVQEEAPALGKPVLVLRDVTERPEGVAAGTCRLVGPHRDKIIGGLEKLLASPGEYERMARAQNPYGDGRASERIVKALLNEPFEEWDSNAMNPPIDVKRI